MKKEEAGLVASCFCCLTALSACGANGEVVIKAGAGNRTPDVVKAMSAVPDGGVVRFEKGEYHFFEEGTTNRFIKMVNGSSGGKKILFDLVQRKDITLDGGDSLFVWHGNVFPIAVESSENICIKNFTSRAFRPSYVEFTIVKANEDGFSLKFNDGVSWKIEDGALLVETDLGVFDSRKSAIPLHALSRCAIHFLFLANKNCSRVGMPSTFMNAVAEDGKDGTVYVHNRHQDMNGCIDRLPYKEGEPLAMLLNGRERCGIFISESKKVTVQNVKMESGDGMGIVSLFTEDLLVDRYRVVPRPGSKVSITADCLFVVNNRGRVEVRDSEMSYSMDDAMNIHGIYMKVSSSEGNKLVVSPIYRSVRGANPFRDGDWIELSAELPRRDVIGSARIVTARFMSDVDVELTLDREVGACPVGTRVENVSATPRLVRIRDSYFHDTMHLRLSGRSPYIIERNRFERGLALLINDLSGYWGECGRTADMTIRDNAFVDFNSRGGWDGFIVAEVEGRDMSQPPPKIHRGLKILDNRYQGIRTRFVHLPCAEDPIVDGNTEGL
ncbi:MAG: hypothetical protein ACOX9C_06935 [Kiritimatiellia bacterium]|jgi:hypothetical protein